MLFNQKIPLKYRHLVQLGVVVCGLLVMFIFSGKSRIDLKAIAVSPDEQYIACFETGREPKIRCFRADGFLSFDYNIPVDISEGGYCSLWFEESELCVLFYRPDKIIHFAMDGTILTTSDSTSNDAPKYPSFNRKGRKYIYDGNKIDVVYDKKPLFGYYLFGAERCLMIVSSDGDENVVYAWSAEKGITQEAQGAVTQ